MSNKIWKIAPRKFDDLIDQILYNRGVIKDGIDQGDKDRFLCPNFETDLHDPYAMKNLEAAVKRIVKAKDNGEMIGVFADYDADGIPGAALFYRALKRLGIPAVVYIPSREGGYGLSREGIDYLVEKGCSLIVTIDLGIRNFSEAVYCKEKKLDLIITDHHLPDEKIPEAIYVVNPKQKNDRYPFKELSGCGVIFKVILGLAKVYPKFLDESFLKWNLDLVAISTIADVVPLLDENRVFAKWGLKVISKTQNMGLRELIKLSKTRSEIIGTYEVGFQIAPRINAPGRIDRATKSFEILVTEDETEAKELAVWLNEKNESRQSAMDEAFSEAVAKILKHDLDKNRIVIVDGVWQKGILGPTASRLVEKFGRPVIMFSRGDISYTGSARSIGNVNIVGVFESVRDVIDKFGGHKGAAGLAVDAKKYDKFITSILEVAETKVRDIDLLKPINIDAELSDELKVTLVDKLSVLEPFGLGNPKPVFISKNVMFENMRFVGSEEKHLSFMANVSGRKSKAIWFNYTTDKSQLESNKKYDIAYSISIDEWQGEKRLSLNIIDIKPSE